MATIKPNSYVLNVDIKQRMSNKTPRFVQFDEAQIVFKIYDGGKPFDLSGFTSAVVTHKTRSNQVISGYGTFEDLNGQRVVVYDYMGSEMKELGNVETSLSIYNDENDKVSVMPFNVQIVRDLSHEYSEKDTSVLQDLIAKTTDAISKIEYAEDQGDYAKEQGTFAETQGNHAKTQGDYAQTQGTRAETLGNKAETQVGQAQDILDVAVPAYERVEEVYSNTVNLENQHAYDATKQYHKNNIVEFNGSSYQALQDTKGNQPPVNASNEYWSLLARKGADGTGTVVRHREEFISTEGQTTFTLKNTYDQFQNRIDVTVGNVPQFSPDNFTEATNTSIKLNEPLPAGIQVVVTYFSEAQPLKNDIQTVVNNHTTNLSAINQEIEDIKVIRHREEFVTTEGQDTFTLKNEYDMNQNRVDVVAGGVPQYSPEHFIEFTNKSIKFTEPFPAGELVIVTYFGKATPLLYDVDTVLDNHSVRLNTSEAELTSISQQLADTDERKADKSEVSESLGRKRDKNIPITLNDAASDLLAAIQNKEGETAFNLLSEPRDSSVTQEKTTMFVPGKNLIDPRRVAVDKNLSFSSGALVDSPGNAASDFIPVEQGQNYIFTKTANMFFYNADKTFHSRVAVSSAVTFTPPAGAAYVRIPFTVADIDSVQLEKGTVRTSHEPFTLKLLDTTVEKDNLGMDVLTEFDRLDAIDRRFALGKNLFNPEKAELGKSLYNGKVVSNADYAVSEYIPIEPNSPYAHTTLAAAFYTDDFTFISGTARGSGVFTTPSNAAYMLITFRIDEINTTQIEKGSERTAYEPYSVFLNDVKIPGNPESPLKGKKGVAFGDSITQNGTYPDYISTNTGADITNVGFGATRLVRLDDPSYPYSKISMSEIADGIASGDFSHMQPYISEIDTTRGDTVYSAIFTRLQSIDFNAVDFVTIMYGTNDINTSSFRLGELDSTDTYTFNGAMNHVISSILTNYPHIKIYLMAPIFKNRMTGIEGNSDEVTRGTVYLYEVAEEVGRQAKKWHVPFKDLYNESGINALTADLYTPDGIHPGAAGRALLNPIIQGFLSTN